MVSAPVCRNDWTRLARAHAPNAVFSGITPSRLSLGISEQEQQRPHSQTWLNSNNKQDGAAAVVPVAVTATTAPDADELTEESQRKRTLEFTN